MPSRQIFFHVKVKKVRFTWKTIPRMGPTNSIPDSKQIGLQKKRAQQHGFFSWSECGGRRGCFAPALLRRPLAASDHSLPADSPGLRPAVVPSEFEPPPFYDQNKKPCLTTRFFFWSECGGSNSRPLRPERSALPTALHPDMSCERKQTSTTHSNIYYITVHEKWKCFFVNFYVFL